MTPYIMTFYRIGYDKAIEAKKRVIFFKEENILYPKNRHFCVVFHSFVLVILTWNLKI